jgi:hypothetical protein
VTVSSWNGVQIAEVARLAPRDLIGETTSGSTILICLRLHPRLVDLRDARRCQRGSTSPWA